MKEEERRNKIMDTLKEAERLIKEIRYKLIPKPKFDIQCSICKQTEAVSDMKTAYDKGWNDIYSNIRLFHNQMTILDIPINKLVCPKHLPFEILSLLCKELYEGFENSNLEKFKENICLLENLIKGMGAENFVKSFCG